MRDLDEVRKRRNLKRVHFARVSLAVGRNLAHLHGVRIAVPGHLEHFLHNAGRVTFHFDGIFWETDGALHQLVLVNLITLLDGILCNRLQITFVTIIIALTHIVVLIVELYVHLLLLDGAFFLAHLLLPLL